MALWAPTINCSTLYIPHARMLAANPAHAPRRSTQRSTAFHVWPSAAVVPLVAADYERAAARLVECEAAWSGSADHG